MRLLSTLAAGALAASSMVSIAVAAPISDQTAVQQMTQSFAPIEKTQFFFGGRNYCFYASGWRGPGWYWCGYAWRRGYGWGGGRGWHGWHEGARRGAVTRGPGRGGVSVTRGPRGGVAVQGPRGGRAVIRSGGGAKGAAHGGKQHH